MKKYFTLVFFGTFISFAFSQTGISLKGRIINKESKVFIPNVSVYISGINIGTSSDEKGYFGITIPKNTTNDSIIFSCIGYNTSKKAISNFKKNNTEIIELEPQVVLLNEMVIIPSNDALKILENSLTSILSNFPNKSYEFDAYYREQIEVNGKCEGFGESFLSGHSEGYSLDFTKDKYKYFPPGWFKINNCRVSDYSIIYDDKGFPRTNLKLSNILYFEHNFITRSLLSKKWRKSQIFTYSSIDYKNGETVLIFHFKPKKTSNKSIVYSGNIYLSSNDYKILKIEFFTHSNNIIMHPFTLFNKKILYDTLCFNFIDISGKNFVSNCTRKFKYLSYKWDTLSKPDTIKTNQKYIVNRIETRVLEDKELERKYGSSISHFDKIRYLTNGNLNDKQYEYDSTFWNDCDICYSKSDNSWLKIKNDLSAPNNSIINQFIKNKGQIVLSKDSIIFLFNHYNKKADGYAKSYQAALLDCK
jgi:hypothetical protein